MMKNRVLLKEFLQLEIKKTRLIIDLLPEGLSAPVKNGFDGFLGVLNEVTKEVIEKQPKKAGDGINKINIE